MKPLSLCAAIVALFVSRPAHACDEVSDVTGYRRCSSFGNGWDLTPAAPPAPAPGKKTGPTSLPLFVDVAAVMQTVDVGSVSFSDTTADSRSFTLRNAGLGAAAAYGVDLRAGFRVVGPFYAGLTARFAFGSLPEHATSTVGGAPVDLGSGLGVVNLGGLLGFAGALSPWARLRLDVAVGVEDAGLLSVGGIQCSAGECSPDSPGVLVEPHAILDFWLGGHWSFGPYVGDDLAHPSRVVLGLVGSWHWQPLDGRP